MRDDDRRGQRAAGLHVMCERDVGLFSLVQQVIANTPWAVQEGRVPIAYFQQRTCYWTPRGYRDRDTVWEYYFEPIVPTFPVASLSAGTRSIIAAKPPSAFDVGYYADDRTFVSAHFGDHPDLQGKALSIPYQLDDPDDSLRQTTSVIIRDYVRPRPYMRETADRFFRCHLNGRYVIGVHIRGTDAVSREEVRPHRQGSLRLWKYAEQIEGMLEREPDALIFVATDAQCSLDFIKTTFGERVIHYDCVRQLSGPAAGKGPTGWIMPAYIAGDRDRAARNGEDAVVEYLLLSRCHSLIHNGSSLARTVLLTTPGMPHVNTHDRHPS
jgi:hypothetical protein